MAKQELLGRNPQFEKFKQVLTQWEKSKNAGWVTLSGPAGVGRSAFLEVALQKFSGSHPVCRVSLLKDSCFRGLARSLGHGMSSDGRVQFSEVIEAWRKRYLTEESGKFPLLVFEDLQELEEVEQGALFQWLQELLQGDLPVLILLEYRDSFNAFLPEFPGPAPEVIRLGPLGEVEVSEWFRRVSGESEVPASAVQSLLQRTGGLPLRLHWWIHFLSGHSKHFFLPEVVKNWPQDENALVLEIMSNLSSEGLAILQVMQLHPSWVTPAMVAAVAGVSPEKVQDILRHWLVKDYVARDTAPSERYLLRFRSLGEAALQDLSEEERRDWHQRCFQFLKSQHDWLFLAIWLAWHGAEGGRARQAFGANLMAAEFFEIQGQTQVAQAYLQRALPFADEPFRRAYCLYRLGEVSLQGRDDALALDRFQASLEEAKSIPWSELEVMASRRLADLLKYLGRYAEAETHFRQVLEAQLYHEIEEAVLRLALGHCLIEQAKYSEAGKLFLELEQHHPLTTDPEFLMAIRLGRLQVDMGLGKFAEATPKLSALQGQLDAETSPLWQPILLLLKGRILILEGQINEALKVLEAAAGAFEANQDIYGKVEVLLAMSAPLLEHNLVTEAEKILNLLSGWRELPEIPALDHSVRLRRLALAAFHGPYRKEDLTLAHQDPFSFGRMEDWLQFWFHLALAGMTRKDPSFFKQFIGKALDITKTVASRLSESDRQSFLRRPDVARIFRLSGESDFAESQKIKADRGSETSEAVEAATLAPPLRDRGDKEDPA